MTAGTDAPGALIRAEIAEQPAAWRRLLTEGRSEIEAAAALLGRTDPELIVFAARGTSDHAAMYAQYLVHARLGVPAMLATPSAFTAYGATLRYPRTVLIAVSQSGESPDLIETVRVAKEAGAAVVAITNSADSTVASLGDVHIGIAAGPERSVAATKTYTASLLALHALVSLAAGDTWEAVADRVAPAIRSAENILAADDPAFDELIERVATTERMLVIGRGYSMSSAREGALKLMETNGVAASGWSAADATHGPLGQVGPTTTVLLLTGAATTRPAAAAFGEKAAALGGSIVSIGESTGGGIHLALPLDSVDETLVPLLEILPFQRLALEAAVRRGLDPDTPEGLAKVTRTH